jgi:hypothetical protein
MSMSEEMRRLLNERKKRMSDLNAKQYSMMSRGII